jgi:acyl carrier protein
MVDEPGSPGVRDRGDILRELSQLLCGRLGISARKLDPESPLEDLGVDSVELAFILTRFERDAGLVFEDAEVDVSRYTTVAEIVDLLAAKLSGAGRGAVADA